MDWRREFKEYKDAEEVQREFFLKELPLEGNGCYWYRKRGLVADFGTAVLFQFHGEIIASAELTYATRFNKIQDRRYRGALYFEPNTIRVFRPIDASEIKRTWPEFKGFGQGRPSLEPRRYARFVRKLTGIMRPAQNRYPSISNMRYCRELSCLRPVLQKWIDLNTNLAKRWHRQGEVPWWYNERALLGLFSNAVWLSKGVSLEEYSDSKREISRRVYKRGHLTGGSFTGRADLYFETSTGCKFRAEAKRCWLAASRLESQRPKLREYFKDVGHDIKQARREKGVRRIAIVFATPYISFAKTTSLEKNVKWAVKQVKDVQSDAVAWAFPKIGKYGKWIDNTEPGIAVLIKEVK
jgi:hypothetical protein